MSAFTLGSIVIGLSLVYAAAGVLIGRRLMRGSVAEGHNDVLAPTFATAGVIYAVLLGLLVVAAWQSYQDAKHNIENEATSLTTLYRLTGGMLHPEERSTMRGAIRDYTKAVIEQEWVTQATTEKPSDLARSAMGTIYRTFSLMQTTESGSHVNGEFLTTLSTIVLDRNRRAVQASERLGGAMWLGLMLGGAIVVGMTFVLCMQRGWPHVLVSCALAGLIGTLLFVTILIDRPFAGPLALDPTPFSYDLNLYDSVDHGG